MTMTSSSSSSSKRRRRAGRNGDPRMHRAVAARLADPNITLYEALSIGGFEYPGHNDPSFMDRNFVTLGQRKNQLARRLRTVRKQISEGGERGEGNQQLSRCPRPERKDIAGEGDSNAGDTKRNNERIVTVTDDDGTGNNTNKNNSSSKTKPQPQTQSDSTVARNSTATRYNDVKECITACLEKSVSAERNLESASVTNRRRLYDFTTLELSRRGGTVVCNAPDSGGTGCSPFGNFSSSHQSLFDSSQLPNNTISSSRWLIPPFQQPTGAVSSSATTLSMLAAAERCVAGSMIQHQATLPSSSNSATTATGLPYIEAPATQSDESTATKQEQRPALAEVESTHWRPMSIGEGVLDKSVTESWIRGFATKAREIEEWENLPSSDSTRSGALIEKTKNSSNNCAVVQPDDPRSAILRNGDAHREKKSNDDDEISTKPEQDRDTIKNNSVFYHDITGMSEFDAPIPDEPVWEGTYILKERCVANGSSAKRCAT